METSRLRIDQPRQRVEVSAFQFGELAKLHEKCRKRVTFFSQFSENTGISRRSGAGSLEDGQV